MKPTPPPISTSPPPLHGVEADDDGDSFQEDYWFSIALVAMALLLILMLMGWAVQRTTSVPVRGPVASNGQGSGIGRSTSPGSNGGGESGDGQQDQGKQDGTEGQSAKQGKSEDVSDADNDSSKSAADEGQASANSKTASNTDSTSGQATQQPVPKSSEEGSRQNSSRQSGNTSSNQPESDSKVSGEDSKYDASASASGSSIQPVGSQGAGFFGLQVKGKHFGYVIDRSSSMAGETFNKTKKELMRSISQLDTEVRFSVFFFSTDVIWDKPLLKAKNTSSKRRRLAAWLSKLFPAGGTDPFPAVKAAIANKCDVVFLLSDGSFSNTEKIVALAKQHGVVIYCVAMHHDSISLKAVAKRTGGAYRLHK